MSGNSCGYDTVYQIYYGQNRTLHPRPRKKPKEVVLNTLQSIPGVRASHEPVVLVSEFGESSVLILWFWLDSTKQDANRITYIVTARTKEAFDEADITIPLPSRTLHLPDVMNGVNGVEKDRLFL